MVLQAASADGVEQRKSLENEKDLKESLDFRGSFNGHQSNRLFLNGGMGKPFVEAGYPSGLAVRGDGRAVVPFDLEGDGN